MRIWPGQQRGDESVELFFPIRILLWVVLAMYSSIYYPSPSKLNRKRETYKNTTA
jgi:hypothetical protein